MKKMVLLIAAVCFAALCFNGLGASTPATAAKAPATAAPASAVKPKKAAKPARVRMPAILLEGDAGAAPPASGPGRRYVLGPAPPPVHLAPAGVNLEKRGRSPCRSRPDTGTLHPARA